MDSKKRSGARGDLIRIGTRGSPLALAQAEETRQRLMQAHSLAEDQFEIVKIVTTGDREQGRPLADIGGKGLFTLELEQALRSGEIDMAVHSMKDVPTLLPEGLEIAAMLPREDARDAFISFAAATLDELPLHAMLGSSSLRRTAQALNRRPDLRPVSFRGNVQTRLRKLQEGIAAATFLAVAGLNRLGLSHHITKIMEPRDMLPAVAQGAIGIEINSSNSRARELAESISHRDTVLAVRCERAFLRELEGSCRTPIAGHAVVKDGRLAFKGELLSEDGQKRSLCDMQGAIEDAEQIGSAVAQKVRAAFV